ncbi:MAG: TonB-dependent receptor [Ignavibacteriales bacterium]|nr:TonB-dependent receptor [Ignavibacteriales bacterium]
MKKSLFVLFFITQLFFVFSQETTQIIRGRVFDSESQISLPGATIFVIESNIGTTADNNGNFVLYKVPVGRISLQVSYLGYENYYISDILVSSGKEIVLNIPLVESFTNLSEIVVKPDIDQDKAINKMATLSAKTFSVEDAKRYAGGMDDPSRLAGSFAGVTPSTVENNEIVIRGNSAKGILWRVEGVEIPAPNHLAGLFSGGGVNTMFNSNMLSNSDFYTGAFSSEYGNALSGVFDINLRTGNNTKREYAMQVGSYGIDFGAEGPFAKGKNTSYLFNYRYSTYGLLQDLVPQVTGLPSYSDLSLKLNFPTKKAGIFSFWSINGIGNIQYVNEKDPSKWETNYDSYDYDIHYNLTASGINHRKIFGNNSYLFSTISFSATEYVNKNIYFHSDLKEIPVTNQNEIDYRYSFSSFFNHKFSNRHTNRTGLIINRIQYKYDVAANTDVANNDAYDFFVKSSGFAYYYQLYSQSKFKLTENIDINSGLHFLLLNTNNEVVVEPRIGINWQLSEKHRLSFAYGKHSKMEPLRIYLMKVKTDFGFETLNKDLNITKAHHLILGYDWKISQNSHLRFEPYYQKLFDVPVIQDSTFSMINYNNEMFFSSQLISKGTGTNVGIDITLERFMKNGSYYMLTSSLFNSKYTGGDGVERNTRYNQNIVLNLLGGKEWQTKKDNTFSLNGKFTILGGRRYAPIDIDKSLSRQFVIYDDSRIYEKKVPTNYYVDISMNYTINKLKSAHSIILQIKNLLLQKEFLGHAYNFRTNSIEPYELTIMFPYISYKILF